MSTTSETIRHKEYRQALERMNRPLRDVDPEIAEIIRARNPPPGHRPRTDSVGESRFRSRARSDGLGAHQQVRRRLSRQALLRRLRIRGSRRATGHRPRQAAFRRRARQRASALRHAGEYRRVHGGAAAGRHGAGHESGARRPPDARAPAEFFRQDLQVRSLRRAQGHRDDRLRRARAPGRRAQAENDRRGRQRLLAHHRFRAHGGDRRSRRRAVSSWTWRTSPAWSPRACIRARCRTPISFRPPRTRRCAGRAAAWCCAGRSGRRNSTASRSPARRAGR